MTSPPVRTATIKQCAILAGGLATRLGAISAETPKPVLEVGGRPFVAWIMREMLRFGVEEFLFLTGHLSDRLERAVRDAARGLPREVRVAFSEEPHRAGTGGALWHAAGQLHDRFLLCNGDSLFACNIATLLADFANDGAEVEARMTVRDVADAGRYGAVVLDADRVAAFRERPAAAAASPGVINAGIYAMDRRVLDRLGPSCSLESDLFAALAAGGRLRATRQGGWFVDIGVPDDLDRARRDIAGSMQRPALVFEAGILLDDGEAGARAAVARAVSLNCHVFAVTNQSAAGWVDAGQVGIDRQMRHLAETLRQSGGTLDDWRHGSPSVATGLTAMVGAWGLDAENCLVVARADGFLQAARSIGMKSERFQEGSLSDERLRQLARA